VSRNSDSDELCGLTQPRRITEERTTFGLVKHILDTSTLVREQWADEVKVKVGIV
jgi:hypothetical protein